MSNGYLVGEKIPEGKRDEMEFLAREMLVAYVENKTWYDAIHAIYDKWKPKHLGIFELECIWHGIDAYEDVGLPKETKDEKTK